MRPRVPVGLAVAGAVLLLLVAVPVGTVVGRALLATASDGRLRGILDDPVTLRALRNSVEQGILAAAGAIVVGFPAGCALGRFRFPGRELGTGLLLVPFLLPTVGMVVGLGAVLGPTGLVGGPWPAVRSLGTGLPGIVLVDVLYNAPLVALLTAVGVASASRELEETAATLGASPGRRFLEVWGRPGVLGAAAGGFLTFALSAMAFAAPLIVGGPANYTLEARIWSLAQQLADPSAAAVVGALGLLVLAPSIVGYLLLLRWLPGRARPTGRPPVPWRAAGPGGAVAFGGLALLGVAELLVLVSVLVHLGAPGSPAAGGGPVTSTLVGPASAARIGLPLGGSVLNSLAFALLAAGLSMLLAIALLATPQRRGPRRSTAATSAPLLLLLVSPIVLGLALAGGFGRVVGVTGVWFLIVLAQAVLAVPFVVQSLSVALGRVPPSLSETARSLGSPPGRAYLEVELPAARAGVVAAGLLAGALALGEFAATYFLAVPRFTTVTVAIYRLESARLVPEATALTAVLVLLSAALLGLASVGGRRVEL